MNKKKELTTSLDGMDITRIEEYAESSLEQAVEGRKVFIETLFYLQRTNRFKENPRYKNSEFKDYLRDKFRLSPAAYHDERLALTNNMAEVREYGLDTVIKIKKNAGALAGVKVFREIQRATKKNKRPPSLELINTTIKKYSCPVPPTVPIEKVDYERKWREEFELRKALELEIEEKDERIGKLIKTVESLRGIWKAV